VSAPWLGKFVLSQSWLKLVYWLTANALTHDEKEGKRTHEITLPKVSPDLIEALEIQIVRIADSGIKDAGFTGE
jgi:hypothetical protein